jgi:glycosyltransferase involved in cell wall biosynthesis
MSLRCPRISVFLPAYNAEQTVVRAARSILDGTFHDIELIVVDDGSTDGSAASVEAINDSRVRLIRIDHAGVAEASNVAIAAARAPIVARMDADDFSYTERLARQFSVMEDSGVDIVGCGVRIVDERGDAVESMRRYEAWLNALTTPEEIAAMRFVESPIVHPTAMARREVWEIGFRDGPFPEDYDFWLRALENGFRAAKTHEVLFEWVDHSGRLTRTDLCYTPEAFDRCRRDALLRGPLKGVREVDVWGAGQTGKPWLRWLSDNKINVRRLIEVSPKKIGERIHGVIAESPESLVQPDRVPLVVAVGAAGAREEITDFLRPRGYTIGGDVWFVA